jgi:hypothetical protein
MNKPSFPAVIQCVRHSVASLAIGASLLTSSFQAGINAGNGAWDATRSHDVAGVVTFSDRGSLLSLGVIDNKLPLMLKQPLSMMLFVDDENGFFGRPVGIVRDILDVVWAIRVFCATLSAIKKLRSAHVMRDK